jgi:hypothetical protein
MLNEKKITGAGDKFAVHEGSKNFNNGRIAFEMFCLVER